jgi:hypothetical protein
MHTTDGAVAQDVQILPQDAKIRPIGGYAVEIVRTSQGFDRPRLK